MPLCLDGNFNWYIISAPLPYVALNFLKTTVVCTVIGHVANEKQENLSPLPKFGKYCGIKEQAIMVNLQLFFA